MLVSSQHKFVFVHIPRTGGTSVEWSLLPLVKKDEVFLNTLHAMGAQANTFSYLETFGKGSNKHINQQEFKKILDKINVDYSEWHEFSFVRNPYDRFLSIYENFARYAAHKGFFKEYLYTVDDVLIQIHNLKHQNKFFESQAYWLSNPITKKLNIYRFENLHEEYKRLLTTINASDLPLHHKQKTEYQTKIVLTDEQKDKIYQIYKDDFVELGYDK